jgi:hypothetical protein
MEWYLSTRTALHQKRQLHWNGLKAKAPSQTQSDWRMFKSHPTTSEEQQVEGSGQGRSGWEPQIPGSSLVFYPPRGISGLTSKPPRLGKLKLRFYSAHTTFSLLLIFTVAFKYYQFCFPVLNDAFVTIQLLF